MDKTIKAVAVAARYAADQRRARNEWNYDTVEVAANYAAAQALEDFADALESPEEEG